MKKILLTCFLALPCLFGSTSFLSLVAQSPGAKLLHRSDSPNRGGPSRPDTFTQFDDFLETSSKTIHTNDVSAIDGGAVRRSSKSETASLRAFARSDDPLHWTPVLSEVEASDIKLNFGLVDSDQDMRVGLEVSGLQSPSFPVFSSQIKQELARLAPESQSLESCFLCLESRNRLSDNVPILQTNESVLFLELPSAYAADTLWLTYWDQYLGDSPELTPGTTIPLVAFQGDFFQGNMGFNIYQWIPTPSPPAPLVFKIRNGTNWLINTWTVFPGDEVRIRFDLTSGNAQFIGPSAEFFRAQYLLTGLAAARKIEIHPLMVTGNPNRMLSDSSTQARFQLARSLSPDLFPPMEFLTPGEKASELLDSLFSQDLGSSLVIRSLPDLSAYLSDLQKERIFQQAWGELLVDHISRLSLGKNLLKQPDNLLRYEKWKAGIPKPRPDERFEPAYIKAFYDLALLEAHIYDQSLYSAVEDKPSALRDLILGRYLMSSWRTKKGDQLTGLQNGLALIETPWIAEKVQFLLASILPGSAFKPSTLVDTDGHPFDLNQLRGKSLLISFWISGCKFCMNYYQTTLKPVFEESKGRGDLVFLSVNADKTESYWKEHLATGNYAHPEMINLHLEGGTGLLKDYSISSFPQKLLIDSDFRLFLLTKNQYSPQELSDLIRSLTGENLTYSVSKPK